MSRINSILFIYLILFSQLDSTPRKHRLADSLILDSTNWSYDSSNNVYYQIGITYCSNPVSTTYETLGIYNPGEYMTCSASNSKYSCSINSSGTKGSYTASNAPYVMPVNTPGYTAMSAPTSYSYNTVSNFLAKGIIYIYAGCRGRYQSSSDSVLSGAPWGVTDLKAAIRFLRYNSDSLPGDLNRFYTFGHSGGGAQSCLMGVTGNSNLFTDYLNEIGAAMTDSNGNEIKDNIKGSQCWCPITNLDTADASYEWNMGQYFSTNTRASGTFTKSLSNDLASKYVEYVNNIKLKDADGNDLTLTDTNSGTYYDYLISLYEESLNNFISDTTFPYTPSSSNGGGGPPGRNQNRNLATTYETADEYIASLNSDETWITKDSTSGKYKIYSVEAFVTHCKSASKSVGAFDDLSKSQAENYLFGYSSTYYTKHFDKIMAGLLTDNANTYNSLSSWSSSYPTDYSNDLTATDSLGKTIESRVNMYNPMYYLSNYYDGYKTSDVADYFRINTGITQTDTASVVEMNLYLALLNYGKKAEFTTVWNQGHTEAERTGSAEDNFISWIAEIEGTKEENSTTSTTTTQASTTTQTSTNNASDNTNKSDDDEEEEEDDDPTIFDGFSNSILKIDKIMICLLVISILI